MLNQMSDRRIGLGKDWCVGEPPVRWDVSFGARLAEKIKQIFWRDGGGDRAVPGAGDPKTMVMRKAA
ncbi:MAG: hypothetical protein JWN40_4357 [Phycisphaerales bacterium]|nr:hypothetical protein [Phycisphaerales bacterium]